MSYTHITMYLFGLIWFIPKGQPGKQSTLRFWANDLYDFEPGELSVYHCDILYAWYFLFEHD